MCIRIAFCPCVHLATPVLLPNTRLFILIPDPSLTHVPHPIYESRRFPIPYKLQRKIPRAPKSNSQLAAAQVCNSALNNLCWSYIGYECLHVHGRGLSHTAVWHPVDQCATSWLPTYRKSLLPSTSFKNLLQPCAAPQQSSTTLRSHMLHFTALYNFSQTYTAHETSTAPCNPLQCSATLNNCQNLCTNSLQRSTTLHELVSLRMPLCYMLHSPPKKNVNACLMRHQ